METPVSSRPLARWSTSASQLIVIVIMPVVFIRTRLYCCRYDRLACTAAALFYSIKYVCTVRFCSSPYYVKNMSPLGVPARQSANPPVKLILIFNSVTRGARRLQHNALSVRYPHLSVRHSVAVAKERTCYPEDHARERARVSR